MTLETSAFLLFALIPSCTADACWTQIRQQGRMSRWSGSTQATLRCEVNMTQCAADRKWMFVWFKFEASSHRKLQFSGKYAQNGSDLLIRDVTANDSGLYYCGLIRNQFTFSGVRDVGGGTLLVVREYSHVKAAMVWTLFVILALYSLALLVLLILKKVQGKTAHLSGQEHSSSTKENSAPPAQFRDVVRELYGKRNLRKHVKKHSPVQPEPFQDQLTDSACIDETVYQNM